MADTRIAVGKIKDEPEYFVLLESKQWQVVSKVKKKKKKRWIRETNLKELSMAKTRTI